MTKPTMITNKAVLAEMQKEIWAMKPEYLEAFLLQISEMAAVEYDIKAWSEREDDFALLVENPNKLQVENGVAFIPINGVLMKDVPFLFKVFDIAATAYPDIQSQLQEAVDRDDVDSIVLRVDSPGGTVAGGEETVKAINDAKAQKPVNAVVEDLAASGAYWLTSQADTITANGNAMVGSIGVYTVAVDYSKMAENEGVKVTVIRSGEHKGMGVVGAEITDNQIKATQEVIDGMAQNFITAVTNGRGMKIEAVTALADGRVWLADQAVKNGLIDSIGNLDSVLNNMKGANIMAETNEKIDTQKIENDAVASERTRFADLKAAFPGDLDFAVKQYQNGASVQDAKVAYNDVLQAKNAKLETEKAELAAKIEKSEAEAPTQDGADPVVHNESSAGSKDFMAVCKEYATENKISMGDAIKTIVHDQPELHQSWIDSRKPVKRHR